MMQGRFRQTTDQGDHIFEDKEKAGVSWLELPVFFRGC